MPGRIRIPRKKPVVHADEVAFAHYGVALTTTASRLAGSFPGGGKEDAVVGVVGVEPFETVPVEINLVQAGCAA